MKSKSTLAYLIIGLIFLIIYIALWIIPSGGFGNILGLPFIIIGVFFMIKWFKRREEKPPTIRQQWKYALQLLLINYTILYFIAIASNFISIGSNIDNIDVFNWPGLLLTVLLIVYIVGFLFSWRKKFFAGIIFIIWFVGVTWVRSIIDSNDLIGFNFTGVVILIQGFLYLAYHYKKLN